MNSAQFIDAVKLVVRDAAVRGTITNITNPPGRRPHDRLVRMAEFYASLSQDQKERLRGVVAEAVDEAIFGLLSVIDGVRALEGAGPKGHLELTYHGAERVTLNPKGGPFLYELYSSEGTP